MPRCEITLLYVLHRLDVASLESWCRSALEIMLEPSQQILTNSRWENIAQGDGQEGQEGKIASCIDLNSAMGGSS